MNGFRIVAKLLLGVFAGAFRFEQLEVKNECAIIRPFPVPSLQMKLGSFAYLFGGLEGEEIAVLLLHPS